ncbi:Oxygen sensor protein DosP [compost metagenome]
MLPYRILIVEDQAFQREYLLSLFRDLGVRSLETAENGEEALRCLRERDFDLVLSDLMMPGLDGVQLIQRMSELREPPPLALMSSSPRRMLGSACQVAKMQGITVVDLIAKPALPLSIRRLIERLESRVHRFAPVVPGERMEFSREELSSALRDGQFQAWFQPKQSLADDRIVGAEALVRWNHPRHGTLLPATFLPALEAAGLDEELLWAMLDQSIGAQAQWSELGCRVPVSVNLPTHLLDDRSLPDRLHDFVIARRGAPAGIVFELLECSFTSDPGNYYAGTCRLRMKGFGLAQDDFSRGYSSFYNLVSTPFTELKIDRTLVHGCAEDETLAAALESLIRLGRNIGLEVVAEGVESAGELAMLRRLGCHRVQGFLISGAVAPQLFARLLMEERPARPH